MRPGDRVRTTAPLTTWSGEVIEAGTEAEVIDVSDGGFLPVVELRVKGVLQDHVISGVPVAAVEHDYRFRTHEQALFERRSTVDPWNPGPRANPVRPAAQDPNAGSSDPAATSADDAWLVRGRGSSGSSGVGVGYRGAAPGLDGGGCVVVVALVAVMVVGAAVIPPLMLWASWLGRDLLPASASTLELAGAGGLVMGRTVAAAAVLAVALRPRPMRAVVTAAAVGAVWTGWHWLVPRWRGDQPDPLWPLDAATGVTVVVVLVVLILGVGASWTPPLDTDWWLLGAGNAWLAWTVHTDTAWRTAPAQRRRWQQTTTELEGYPFDPGMVLVVLFALPVAATVMFTLLDWRNAHRRR